MEVASTKFRNPEIEKLAVDSQNGSSEAFGRLYDIFVNPIYRYIYYRAGAKEAEDMTELVFLKTWENIRQYKHGQRSFSAWIFRIAHNVVVDYFRALHAEDELKDEAADNRREADSTHAANDAFTGKALEAAMRQLKDHYRQIIVLKYFNGLSNEEIGFIMSRSQAALRILQFRALRKLRGILERMGISDINA